MNKFRKVLERSLDLAALNQRDEALATLSRGIKEAIKENDSSWTVLLAKNAGLLLERTGQLEQAKSAYELALQHNKSDPYLHWSLGNVYKQLGQHDVARASFDESHRLASEQQDEDLLKVLRQRDETV